MCAECSVCAFQGCGVGKLVSNPSWPAPAPWGRILPVTRLEEGSCPRNSTARTPAESGEGWGQELRGFLMRGQSLECTRRFIWSGSAICFSRIPIMLNEHKHTNGETASVPGKQGWLHNPSSLVTPVTFFSSALLLPRELCYEVRARVKLVDLIRRQIF